MWPASASAGRMSGVPRKPVPPGRRTSRTSAASAAADARRARRAGTSPNRSADRAAGLGRDGMVAPARPRRAARRVGEGVARGRPTARRRAAAAASPASRALWAKNALARKSESALASQGRSAGASGSSQSPNCVARAQQAVRARAAPRSESTQRRMLASWSRRTAGSPYDSYTAHGTMVAASAQPARPKRSVARRGPRRAPPTARPARRPARAPGPAASSPRTPGSRTACWPVGANACASPVQPSRSSRCGQSVGTDTKLSRCDQTTFSCSRSSRGSEHANVDRGGVSLLMATNAALEDLGVGLDLRVPEPVEREAPARGRPRRRRRACRCRSPWPIAATAVWSEPSGSSTSAWRTVTASPRRPRTRSRTKPAMFWPPSSWTSAAGPRPTGSTGQVARRRRTGGAMRGSMTRGVDGHDARPAASRWCRSPGGPSRRRRTRRSMTQPS